MIAVAFQQRPGQLAHAVLIIDQEQCPAIAMRRDRRGLCLVRPDDACRRRQQHAEFGANAWDGDQVDVAIVPLDDFQDIRQTQAGAALFGREERLEDSRGNLRPHAWSVVGHADVDVAAGDNLTVRQAMIAQLDRVRDDIDQGLGGRGPHGKHRITRVDTQIQDDLLQLGRVAGNVRQIGLDTVPKLDAFTDRMPKEIQQLPQQLAERNWPMDAVCAAHEFEELLQHFRLPLEGLFDRVQ